MHSYKKYIANCITGLGVIFGIIACTQVIRDPSWIIAEILLVGALITDGLDGRAARKFGSTKSGQYLDDIADAINFGLHPALWIWLCTGSGILGGLYFICIIYRLTRFTLKKQSETSYLIGLGSPAAAIGVLGWIPLEHPAMIDMIAFLFISFLAISSLRTIHFMKWGHLGKTIPLLLLAIIFLPWLYGGGILGISITQSVIFLIYLLLSILLLMPSYAVE